MIVNTIMKIAVGLTVLAALVGVHASLDNNLVYRSPLEDHPQFGHDLTALEARHSQHAKRQMTSADGLTDSKYPTFYGADFSNSPFVFSGGITFTHSVASGDPFDTSVLLWTRALPSALVTSPPDEPDSTSTPGPPGTPPFAPGSTVPDQSVPVCVSYVIAATEDLSDPVDSGSAFTSWDVDFTVKVEATNLEPDSVYFYQFADCTDEGKKSDVGRTRTLPSPDTPAESVNDGKPITLAVFSCSQFQAGWFNAYGVAHHNASADFFVHLGDYIYESLGNGASINRTVLGRELATIQDYRQRLAQYRTDASLIVAHRENPWITVWDDHEVADNSWKAGTADSNDSIPTNGCAFSVAKGGGNAGACFTDRKMAGVRAYHEWLPIRQVKADDKLRIWRGFQIGELVDLMMLDTRQYDRDLTDVYFNTDVRQIAGFQNRSLMGAEQEGWFRDQLTASQSRGAAWRVVGQQIVFTNLKLAGGETNVVSSTATTSQPPCAFPFALPNMDSWDGYLANRARILQHIADNKIDNVVVLSGDSHANWVSDLAFPNDTSYDPQSGTNALGVEFAGTAVTSGSSFGPLQPAQADNVSACLTSVNPDLQWSEGFYRGFFTLTVSKEAMNASYYAMRDITNANLDFFKSANFTVVSGQNKLMRPVAGGRVDAGALKGNETVPGGVCSA